MRDYESKFLIFLKWIQSERPNVKTLQGVDGDVVQACPENLNHGRRANATYNGHYHGKPTITRPDPTPMLDEWERKFNEIIVEKTRGKLPIKYPVVESMPEIPPPRKPTQPQRR